MECLKVLEHCPYNLWLQEHFIALTDTMSSVEKMQNFGQAPTVQMLKEYCGVVLMSHDTFKSGVMIELTGRLKIMKRQCTKSNWVQQSVNVRAISQSYITY